MQLNNFFSWLLKVVKALTQTKDSWTYTWITSNHLNKLKENSFCGVFKIYFNLLIIVSNGLAIIKYINNVKNYAVMW